MTLGGNTIQREGGCRAVKGWSNLYRHPHDNADTHVGGKKYNFSRGKRQFKEEKRGLDMTHITKAEVYSQKGTE